MRQFHINIRSFRQVRDFVALAMVQPFEVLIGNEKQMVNAKGYMGMLTLDYKRPLRVSVRCNDEEFGKFQRETAKIFA